MALLVGSMIKRWILVALCIWWRPLHNVSVPLLSCERSMTKKLNSLIMILPAPRAMSGDQHCPIYLWFHLRTSMTLRNLCMRVTILHCGSLGIRSVPPYESYNSSVYFFIFPIAGNEFLVIFEFTFLSFFSNSGSVYERPNFYKDCVWTRLVEKFRKDMGISEEFINHRRVCKDTAKLRHF